MTNYKTVANSADKIFESALQKIDGRLEIKRKEANVGLKLLKRFDELKKYNSVYIHKVTEFKGELNSFIVLLVEKHLTIVEFRKSGRREKEIEEIEPMLIFSISTDIGRAIIKQETIADKIADLFHKVDIDFKEFPRFSRNYVVVGENPDLVRSQLPRQLIETLDKIEKMTVEINGNWGLLRPEKNLTENLLLLLISIGYKMTK